MQNLDYLAAKYGQELGLGTADVENAVTDALNILHEQGVFAMFLWLHEKPNDRGCVGKTLSRLLQDPESPVRVAQNLYDAKHTAAALVLVREQLTRNLKTMFLAKDLVAQTLIYARHAAKAKSSEENHHD